MLMQYRLAVQEDILLFKILEDGTEMLSQNTGN
jgi:hypothetical protein